MDSKRSILWVEDAAYSDYAPLLTWVLVDGRFRIDVAQDASEAVMRARSTRYDVIILDLHLPPGRNLEWTARYQGSARARRIPLLGLELIEELLSCSVADQALRWVSPDRMGILSIEPPAPFRLSLNRLRIGCYRQKSLFLSESTLVEMAEELISTNGCQSATKITS